MFVSMLEIYNEAIHDLLSTNTDNKLDIKLKSDGYYVPGLTQVSVSNLDEVNTVSLNFHVSVWSQVLLPPYGRCFY